MSRASLPNWLYLPLSSRFSLSMRLAFYCTESITSSLSINANSWLVDQISAQINGRPAASVRSLKFVLFVLSFIVLLAMVDDTV